MRKKFKNFQELLEGFRKECLLDKETVGLWQIVSHMQQDFDAKAEQDLKKKTFEFIRLMLAEGFKAGSSEYSATGYIPWKEQNPDQVIERINTEWNALGRVPNIGDIVYFDLRS